MFPILFKALTYEPARVKTEASFTADDPWNHNQRTSFNIEVYILAPKGTKPIAAAKPIFGSYRYGIRSEADGIVRMLPESLEHLWHDNRVPAEALPRLLKELAPTLKRSDFAGYLDKDSKKKQSVLVGLFAAFGVVLLVLLGLLAALSDSTSERIELAFGCVLLVLLFGGLRYLAFSRPRARRRRQMDWALSHI